MQCAFLQYTPRMYRYGYQYAFPIEMLLIEPMTAFLSDKNDPSFSKTFMSLSAVSAGNLDIRGQTQLSYHPLCKSMGRHCIDSHEF
jgi:hypothetical protein